MDPNQLINQQLSPTPTQQPDQPTGLIPPTPIAPPPSVPSHKTFPTKKALLLIISLIVLTVFGFYLWIKIKPIITRSTSISDSVSVSPMPKKDDGWQEYEVKSVGLKLKLPNSFVQSESWSETASHGSAVSGYALTAGITNNEYIWSEQSHFNLYAHTNDYLIERGPSFDEGQNGYTVKNKQFYLYDNEPVPSQLSSLVKSKSGIETLKVKCVYDPTKDYDELPPFWASCRGFIGIINLPANISNYHSVVISMNDASDSLESDFDKILATLEFVTPKMKTVKLYHSGANDPQDDSCEVNTYTEIQLPDIDSLIDNTIQALVDKKYINNEERYNFMPKASSLKDGVLTLEFPVIPSVTEGGSCNVFQQRSVIEKTVLQFPEVKQVILKPDDNFQP